MSIAIDQALTQAFINGNFLLPIAHENLEYAPDGSPYAEIRVLQNDITPYSMNSTDETSGVMTIILRYPAKNGAVPAKTKADEIMTVFKIGTVLNYGAVSATVVKVQRQAGVAESGIFKIVIVVSYRSFILR